MTVDGERIATGLTRSARFIGDHTKTGLGTLLNTGSVVGAFCKLLPTGTSCPGACRRSVRWATAIWRSKPTCGSSSPRPPPSCAAGGAS